VSKEAALFTILTGVLTILAAVTLAVGGLALMYRFASIPLLQEHYSATGAIYAALYVMFGISIGFSLYLVWQQYEAGIQTVEKEATALLQVYRSAQEFPDPERGRVQDLAVSYARVEVEEEWPLMNDGHASPRADQVLDELGHAVRDLNPKTNAQDALYSDALNRLDVIRDNRTLRLVELRAGVPIVVWVVMVAGAVITVAFTYLFAMKSFRLHAVATGALTVVVVLLLFTVGVLDYAFNGDIRVSPKAFELALEEMEKGQT
jgi:hypothetical protein